MPRHLKVCVIASMVILAIAAVLETRTIAQGQDIRIAKGTSNDAWYGFNVKGKLNYVVRTRDKSNKIRAFWRTWGFGNERELGTLTNEGEIEIPISLWRGVISARLRVEADDDTVLALRENAKVAHTVSFTWP
jgi:hypothetical protein